MTFMEKIKEEFENGLNFDQVVERHEITKLQLAKYLLGLCEREELRDHAFGDREVFWTFDGVEVAGGYFGSVDQNVWLLDMEAGTEIAGFRKDDAYELVKHGKLKGITRNDMQGESIPRYLGR